MSTKIERENVKFQLVLVREEAKKLVCKTLWETLEGFQKDMREVYEIGHSSEFRLVLACLCDMKVKLIEALPYGPDEVN